MKQIDILTMLENKKHITIDIVGDSVTQGTDHCTEDETYAAQYAKMLAKKYPHAAVCRYDGVVENGLMPIKYFKGPIIVSEGDTDYKIDVIKNGVGGNTLRRAIKRIDDFTNILPNGKRADITVFMFGINDALKSDKEKYVTAQKFAADYEELLNKFKQKEDREIGIMSATTNDQTIEEHVKAAKSVAQKNNILYVDQHAVWTKHYDKNACNFGYGDWLSNKPGDACHPTPKGAYVIAKTLFDSIN